MPERVEVTGLVQGGVGYYGAWRKILPPDCPCCGSRKSWELHDLIPASWIGGKVQLMAVLLEAPPAKEDDDADA